MGKKQKIDYSGLFARSAKKIVAHTDPPCVFSTVMVPAAVILGVVPVTLFTIYKKKCLLQDDLNSALGQLNYMDGSQIYKLASSIVKSDLNFKNKNENSIQENLQEDQYGHYKHHMKHAGFYELQVKLSLVFELMQKIINDMTEDMKKEMIHDSRINSASEENNVPPINYISTLVKGKKYHLPLHFYNDMENAVYLCVKNQFETHLTEKFKPEIFSLIREFMLDQRDAGCKGQYLIIEKISQLQSDKEALSSEASGNMQGYSSRR